MRLEAMGTQKGQRTTRAAEVQIHRNQRVPQAGQELGWDICVVTPPLAGGCHLLGVSFLTCMSSTDRFWCLGSGITAWCPPLPPTRP